MGLTGIPSLDSWVCYVDSRKLEIEHSSVPNLAVGGRISAARVSNH